MPSSASIQFTELHSGLRGGDRPSQQTIRRLFLGRLSLDGSGIVGGDIKCLRVCLAKVGPFRWKTVSAVKIAFLPVPKRKEKIDLYGATELNRCIQTRL